MIGWAKWLVGRFGYPGLFVALIIDGLGVPFPGQTLLAFSGFLASRGVLALGWLLVAGIAGGFIGTVSAFLLVRFWGDDWLELISRRVPALRAGADGVRELAGTYGLWVLLIGRFLPAVGNTAPYFVAMGSTRFLTFAAVDLLGVCCWAGVPVIAGYLLGEEWTRLAGWLGPLGRWLLAAAVVVAAAFWAYRRWGSAVRLGGE